MFVLKVGMFNVGFRPFAVLGFEFFLTGGCCNGDGVYGKTVFQLLHPASMWFSSPLPDVYLSFSQPLGFLKRNLFHM